MPIDSIPEQLGTGINTISELSARELFRPFVGFFLSSMAKSKLKVIYQMRKKKQEKTKDIWTYICISISVGLFKQRGINIEL